MPEDDGQPPDFSRFTNRGLLSFTGIVLAGGQSRRFGELNKAVALLNGSTFIERVIDTVRAVADESPIIAINSDDQRSTIEAGLESVTDPRFVSDASSFGGPLAGLYGSVPAVDHEWLFLTGCDMPLLSAPAIAWLAERLRTVDSSPDALVPVRPNGKREPLHAFYRRDAVMDVRNRLQTDAGLRTILDELSDTTTVPLSAAPPDVSLADSLRNVNTRREYRNVRRTIPPDENDSGHVQ